jgi:excisionase family DNA binding protein
VTDRLLTAVEVGELLGFAPATIVDWAEAEKIPSFKIGGRLRFRLSEVDAWLEGRRGGPNGEERCQAIHPRARQRSSLGVSSDRKGGTMSPTPEARGREAHV